MGIRGVWGRMEVLVEGIAAPAQLERRIKKDPKTKPTGDDEMEKKVGER